MMEEEKSDKKKNSGRRISSFHMKKKVVSKIGESKLGRSTVVKMMGQEADDIISALKNAVCKTHDRPMAKELKKDTLKWVSKASLLVQHKQLTADNTRHLLRPVQMLAERTLDIHDKFPAGKRDISKVSAEMKNVGRELHKVLEPHSQDKNVEKVDRLVNFYSDPSFLTKLMNDDELQEERTAIINALRTVLLPLPSVLYDEESVRIAKARVEMINVELSGSSMDLCFDKQHPEVGNTFAKFLDTLPDRGLGSSFRFLLSEQEFVQISAPNIRASRAETLFNKYFLTSTDFQHLSEELKKVQDMIEDGHPPKGTFEPLRKGLTDKLRPAFEQFFRGDQHFQEYLATIRKERDELLSIYGERIAETDAAQQQQMPMMLAAIGDGTYGVAATSN